MSERSGGQPQTEMMSEYPFPLVAEAIGTFALIFLGAGSTIMTGGNNLVAIGLMIAAAGHISGGAYNPAVTLGLFIAGKLSPLKAAGYVVQLIGATLAALMLKAIFPSELIDPVKLGVPAVGPGFSNGNALVAEIVTTFFLMYVIFGVAIDRRGPASIAALCIGLTITIDIFGTGAVSGAAMNPARWFGPALVDGDWDTGWSWIVGPAIGASLAAVLYWFFYLQGRDSATE